MQKELSNTLHLFIYGEFRFMSDFELWNSLYDSGDFAHWEAVYESPELSALVAAGFIGTKAKILDAGCGGGLDSIFLAQCGFSVLGIDFSRAGLRIASKRAEKAQVKVQWHMGSVFHLPLDCNVIDFISDRGVFHVIEDADRMNYGSGNISSFEGWRYSVD